MAKTKKTEVEAVAAEPVAPPVEKNWYRVNIRKTLDNGRLQGHPWLPWTIEVEGNSPDDAIKNLVDEVKKSVIQVEKAR